MGRELRVDGDRLADRLAELAAVGAIPGTQGCARLALTDADRAGRDLVVGWMVDLAMDVRVDRLGNVVAVWGGTEPAAAPVMTGSHIDTVATGGRYDGNYGVLAGLEVIETLAAAGVRPRRPLAVAFFTDEEGARFAPDMLGSLAYVGGLEVEAARSVTGFDGTTVGGELDRIGYSGGWPCPVVVPHAFVELHIEQGPVLEATGIEVGAVTGVQGISWQELTVNGQSNHAGTTPMNMRRDATYGAARIATFVHELAHRIGGSQVATVGKFDLYPNLVNVVAARATLTVDLRNTDEVVLQRAEAELATFVRAVAEEVDVTISARELARFEPVQFDERIVSLVEATALARGRTVRRMPSGAGHDAQMLARLCPAGMIFVPSAGGLSHNPAEYTAPEDLVAGANVLLDVLTSLAREG